ncbi:hypothetical protein AX14_007908 [Amanita brunnescens Koide BX004]|nr:hypothetical protein AX14_007908 [Amanita brunnescens Koide BX004]
MAASYSRLDHCGLKPLDASCLDNVQSIDNLLCAGKRHPFMQGRKGIPSASGYRVVKLFPLSCFLLYIVLPVLSFLMWCPFIGPYIRWYGCASRRERQAINDGPAPVRNAIGLDTRQFCKHCPRLTASHPWKSTSSEHHSLGTRSFSRHPPAHFEDEYCNTLTNSSDTQKHAAQPHVVSSFVLAVHILLTRHHTAAFRVPQTSHSFLDTSSTKAARIYTAISISPPFIGAPSARQFVHLSRLHTTLFVHHAIFAAVDVSRENGNISPAASSQPQLSFSLFIAAVVTSGSSAQPEAHVPSRRPAAASFDAVHPHGDIKEYAKQGIRARIQNDKHDVEDILS